MQKIKILYVIPCFAKAGTEKQLLGLARGLDRDRFDVSICCLFERGQIEDQGEGIAFPITCLGRTNVYDLRIIGDLMRIVRQGRFDIVHTFLFGFHYLATLPAKFMGVPVTCSSRRELATWKRWHHHLLEWLGDAFTDTIIANAHAVKTFSMHDENLPAHRIVTIHNGVDTKKFSPLQKDVRVIRELGLEGTGGVIGTVANFSPVKNHAVLLDALRELKKTYPRIKCVLVGDGKLRKPLEQKAAELDMRDNVVFCGRRDDVAGILRVLDVFVLPSQSEGCPNSVLEAMACGIPVVAARVGGIPEVVEDGKSGILVEAGDARGLADAIARLLRDERIRAEMGRRGREIAEERFSLERMVGDYGELYVKLRARSGKAHV